MALRGGFGDCSADARWHSLYELMGMSVKLTIKFVYPKLMRVDKGGGEEQVRYREWGIFISIIRKL